MRPPIFLATVTATALLLPGAALARSGDPESGSDLFERNCAMCHGRDASGMMGMHPSLRGAVERLTLEGVEVTIRKGRDTIPPMPSFEGRLSQEEIDDVVAYLDTLPVGPRNFGGGSGMMHGNGMMGGGMWGWMMGAAVFLVVVAALVIGAAVIARRLGGRGRSGSSALDILDQRYARGDIDRNEYEERRRALQQE